MDQKLLIVNTGSASKKYALYEGGIELFRAHFEREDGELIVTVKVRSQEEKVQIGQKEYDASISWVISQLMEKELIADASKIRAVGLRVVAPGKLFLEHKLLDSLYLSKLKEARQEAPLHINPVIAEIEHLGEVLPKSSIVAVSDSAFHKTMPEVSRRYSLPADFAQRYGIYRFGYHGISMASVAGKIEEMLGSTPPRVVICHLGSGSTITALKDGESFDTSMGFTPLEGLVMGTRVGSIDAGAVLYLVQKSGMGLDELGSFFNLRCGLLGLSGKTADIRELIELESGGDRQAKLALDVFVSQVKKYIGAYAGQMGGLDLLVFTATIGERSFIMRERICVGLEFLGIELNGAKNNALESIQGFINSDQSKVKVAVIPTNEMGEIAKVTQNTITLDSLDKNKAA